MSEISDIEYIEVIDFKGIHEVRGNRWRVHSHRDVGKQRIYLLERIHYEGSKEPVLPWNGSREREENWRESLRRRGSSA